MFSFFKKWRRAKEQDAGLSESQLEAMRMMQAAKDEIMPRVREVLDHWRVNRLECSRVMSEEYFAERLVAIQDNGVHSFEDMAKIEARALLSVWLEAAADRKQEFSQFLDEEAREFAEFLEIGPEIENLLDREIAEATIRLAKSIDATIDQAIERRGEVRNSD